MALFRRHRDEPRPPLAAEARSRWAVERARHTLQERWPDLVAHVFCYGAVAIDPSHLVVWVELAGDPDHLPEWWFPDGHEDAGRPGDAVPAEILAAMRQVVVDALARIGWPTPAATKVGFESADRVVAGGGGWQYYR